MEGMNWPTPNIQPVGSLDCEFYAVSYLAKLFGHEVSPEDPKKFREETRKIGTAFLEENLNIKPSWHWGITGGSQGMRISYTRSLGYKKWVQAYCEAGYIALAAIQLIPQYQHMVVLLDADDEGVLLADSCRGLIKDSWETHLTIQKGHVAGRIEAWYYMEKDHV